MASRRIDIEYNIETQDLKIAGEETMSLTQRVRILKKELQKGDLKPEQFDILRKKIGDYEDKIKSSTVRSRNFFEVLGTLPGPVGAFGASINGVIETLKVLSSFSLKDIGNSVKDVGDDIGDITNNLGGFKNASKDVDDTIQKVSQTTNTFGNTMTTAAATAGATAGALSNVKNQFDLVRISTDQAGRKVLESVKPYKDLTEAERELFKEQRNRIVHSTEAATAFEQQSKQMEAGAKSARGLAASLKGIGAALGIGAILAVIGLAIGKLIEYIDKWNEATEEQKAATKAVADFKVKLFDVQNTIKAARQGVISKEEALKKYNDTLGSTVGYAKDLDEAENLLVTNTDTVIQSIRLRAMAQVFYGKSAEAAAKLVSGEGIKPTFWESTLNFLKSGMNPVVSITADVETMAEKMGQLNDESKSFAEQGDKLIQQALELEKTLAGTRTKPTETKGGADEVYNKRLADLDARIQLEINKEKTSQQVLDGLLEERAKMVIKKEKMTYAQQQLLRQENSKKSQDALQEDSDRLMSFIQKRNEILINADKDEQTREEALLAEKLYFDKYAMSKDTEFKKKSKEEQQQIFTAMEEKYQQDLLKIKEKYFLKELDKQKEIDKQKRDNAVTEGELLLELNQQLLQKKIDINDYLEVLLTKNSKEVFGKYFVDLRQLYKKNYEDTESSINAELLAIQTANQNKKLSDEEYANRKRELEQQLIDNKNNYVQKQIELDDLERSSREAVVDKFSELAQRTLDFYNALIDISQANMDREMKDYDERLKLYDKDSEEYNKILDEKRAAEEANLKKIKKLQTAAAIADAAIQIARVIIDTQRAIVSFAASVAPLGPAGVPIAAAYATAAKVLAGISIATITASGIAKIKQIQSQELSDSGGDSGGGNNLGRGYEKGGLIGGRRHAQGGTLIEAEQGEAVMTRGAVTMFKPLLSLMNQAGGGTSFNTPNALVTLPDNPIVKNPVEENQPIIMKTYVVESELTTIQQRQARLKDLSTL